MKLTPYYQFYSIRKDLLKRSQAKANHKPVYKVRRKSAKVLERELIKVKVKYGATKFGYSFCCTKPPCVFCGELGTLRYKLYQHKEQYSSPRIFKPKDGPHEVVTVNRCGREPLFSNKLRSWKELEYQDQIRAQREREEHLQELREAKEWSERKYAEREAERFAKPNK
jgi:hypothetical protein